jgi:hypothetical protein
LTPGTLIQLYENPIVTGRSGFVMVGMSSTPDVLYDVPDGTYAMIVNELIDSSDDIEPVAEVMIDGQVGYVQLSCCIEV